MLSFISLFKPETWLSETSGIMGAIVGGLRTLLFNIVIIVYELIVNVYNLFEKLCNARILDNDIIEIIGRRVGMLLGLIMFFYIIFGFIQMILDPDKITDKEKGVTQIAKKAILVVVMLGVSNIAFSALFGIQKKIIDYNVIENILLPFNIQTKDGSELDNFGNILSTNLLRAFYYIDDEFLNESSEVTFKGDSATQKGECEIYVDAFYNQVYQYNRYDLGYVCLNQSVDITRKTDTKTIDDQIYIVNFNGIIAPLVGGYTVYLLLMYCFKVGVRMIQLAFLEIISPMAIISYLSPKKDNMFTKWWKIYFSTYIDVFIRIAIINLMVFLICTIFATDSIKGDFFETVNVSGPTEKMFLTVVIVLSLLTFAKKAPDLLKELFPSSGGSKLGFGASMKDIVGLKETIGMTAGATTASAIGLVGGIAGGKGLSRITGAFGGLAGGMFRGGKAGFGAKGFGKAMSSARDAQAKANIARAQRIASGSTLGERMGDATKGFFGIQSGYEGVDRTVGVYDTLNSLINDEDIVKDYQKLYDTALAEYGKNATTANANRLRDAEAQLKTVKETLFDSIVTGRKFASGSSLTDKNGNKFNLIRDLEANDSMKNSLRNVEKVSGKTYSNLSSFKADRNKLKAEKMNKTKK